MFFVESDPVFLFQCTYNKQRCIHEDKGKQLCVCELTTIASHNGH